MNLQAVYDLPPQSKRLDWEKIIFTSFSNLEIYTHMFQTYMTLSQSKRLD